MKAQWSLLIVGLMFVSFAAPVFAESDEVTSGEVMSSDTQETQELYAKGKKRKPAAARKPAQKIESPTAAAETRKPASVESVQATTPSIQAAKEWEAMVSLAGGFAKTTSSDTNAQNMRDAGNYGKNGYGALMLDSRFKTYAGLELEGFFGSGSTANTTEVNKVSGAVTTNSHKLGQNGWDATVKGQYPIQVDRWTIWPKAGLGYGMLSTKETVTSAAGAETENKESVKAPVFLVGIDSEPVPNVYFGFDYLMSLGGSGTLTTGTTEADTASASFYRFRVNAGYKFTPMFSAGLQYNRRQLKYTAAATVASPSPAETSEGINQYLGVVTVQF